MKIRLAAMFLVLLGAALIASEASAHRRGSRIIDGVIVQVRKHAILVQSRGRHDDDDDDDDDDGDDNDHGDGHGDRDRFELIHIHDRTPIKLNGQRVRLRDLQAGDRVHVHVTKDRDHLRFKLQAMVTRARRAG